eukprot:CAMPEP_0206426078 /NCGR_PEP_ID=MMETSP0324_2-20121206/4165_1 /ASSEMBLY_ACC=CAM_ASM_000836 /TAXON_ID=2866 /ORGANISM="Crypthecodinium cohnii, Strain Seligo" /LENGTH=520 /DNA_ID=CAMNT_0053890967 /DNA_START=82 /DNA_END=1641 /DNA_ORIENTATION=-
MPGQTVPAGWAPPQDATTESKKHVNDGDASEDDDDDDEDEDEDEVPQPEVQDQFDLRRRFTVNRVGVPSTSSSSSSSVPGVIPSAIKLPTDKEPTAVDEKPPLDAAAKELVRKRFGKIRTMVKLMGAVRLASQMKLPEKCGWLERITGSTLFGQSTDRVWVVLRDNTLRWYENPQDTKPLGSIDLHLVPTEVQRQWALVPEVVGRPPTTVSKRCGGCDFMQPIIQALLSSEEAAIFKLAPLQPRLGGDASDQSSDGLQWLASSLAEGEEWVKAIAAHTTEVEPEALEEEFAPEIGRQIGSGNAEPTDDGWWKVKSITPGKFSLIARTGDILLFRSPGTLPQLIRTASGGRFDHVALLLRLDGGRIGLLEATGNQGVGLCSWDEFVGNEWYQIYPEIALRRVSFERSEDSLTELQQWAGRVLGKPYSLSIGKLMQRKSISAGGLPNDGAYFCSQLVAEALKVLKVIPRGKSSTQFWPASFEAATKPQPECNDGCSFDDQLTLDFGGKPKSGKGAQPGRDVT